MAGTDLMALVVAVVGVAGTMGAPWLSQRVHQGEAREQAERDEHAREWERRDRAFERRRDLYAALNSTARVYRSVTRDVALSLRRGESVVHGGLAGIDRAREAYRAQYAQAQMVLPQRALEVAEETIRCLGHGYELVRRLALASDPRQAAEPTLAWLRGLLSDAVLLLLRQALREDLGVIEPIYDLEDRLGKLADDRVVHGAEAARD